MRGSLIENDRPAYYEPLLKEIMSGEMVRDVLPNPSYDFAEERQARYYSNMRWNMESDMAMMVMNEHQQCQELDILKGWKNNE